MLGLESGSPMYNMTCLSPSPVKVGPISAVISTSPAFSLPPPKKEPVRVWECLEVSRMKPGR